MVGLESEGDTAMSEEDLSLLHQDPETARVKYDLIRVLPGSVEKATVKREPFPGGKEYWEVHMIVTPR